MAMASLGRRNATRGAEAGWMPSGGRVAPAPRRPAVSMGAWRRFSGLEPVTTAPPETAGVAGDSTWSAVALAARPPKPARTPALASPCAGPYGFQPGIIVIKAFGQHSRPLGRV
jgi:hypothetical protein